MANGGRGGQLNRMLPYVALNCRRTASVSFVACRMARLDSSLDAALMASNRAALAATDVAMVPPLSFIAVMAA